VYVIVGGGLTVSGNGGLTDDPDGVFIFNAGSGYHADSNGNMIDGGTYGAITLGGNGNVNLKPMATGGYAGILIFQSRSNTKVLNIGGSSSLTTTGAIYAPAAQLAISGSGSLHDTLVVNSLYVSGSAGAFQLTNGSSSDYQVSASNMLVDPILTVAVEDDTGDGLDANAVADLTASMSYLNSALAQFGVNLSWAPDPATADVRIHFAPTTPEGGFDQGVLGFTASSNDVYFPTGWNVYMGQDPLGIGSSQYDFQTLAIHELAHTLGLGESADPNSVMYEYLAAGTVRRTLTDSNLALISTDADRFMKAAPTKSSAPGSLALPGVGPATGLMVGLSAPTVGDLTVGGMIGGLGQLGPKQGSAGSDDLAGRAGYHPHLGLTGRDYRTCEFGRSSRGAGLNGPRTLNPASIGIDGTLLIGADDRFQ
jgi:hypothetical protein